MFDIHIAVELSAPVHRASITSLQRNEDGQIGVLTRAALHILTPNIGMSYDLGSAEVAVVAAHHKPGIEPIKLYRAVADIGLYDHFTWADECLEMASLVPGSVSIQCKDFTWSPAGIGKHGTCLAAVLNTNLEVFVFGSGKNYVDGEWPRLMSLTSLLLNDGKPAPTNASSGTTPLKKVLEAQTSALAWSGAVDIDGVPPSRDLSFLALGNRAGGICLWRYGGPEGWTRSAYVEVSEDWITNLAWSPWVRREPLSAACSLACALPDGSVRLVTVMQNISEGEVKAQCQPVPLVAPDGRDITALKWLQLDDTSRHILVYSKPGILGLVAPDGSGLAWTGNRRLLLQKIPVFSGATALGIPAGFDYLPTEDVLVASYSDGSIQVVYGVSTNPTFELSGSPIGPVLLTSRRRNICVEIEGSDSSEVAVMQTFGACVPTDRVALWSYMKTHPTFLEYLAESNQITTLVMATMLDNPENPVRSLNNVESICNPQHPAYGTRSHRGERLLSIYLDLLMNRDSQEVKDGISRILEVSVPDSSGILLDPPSPGKKGSSGEDALRSQLTANLCKQRDLDILRSKLAVLGLAVKLGYTVSQDQRELIQHIILAHIISGFLRVMRGQQSLVLERDRPFFQRMVAIASQLPVDVQSLKAASEDLAQSIGLNLTQIGRPDALHESGESSTKLRTPIDVGDACVVCKFSMPISSLERVRCRSGHIWERCSITTFPLATPNVRTCVGCGRKALLPPSELNGRRVTHGWFADLVLETVQTCLLCGGRFVRIL